MALTDDYFIEQIPGNTSPKNLSIASRTTAGGVYMAKLGDYMFAMETAAFERLERATKYRWSPQKRVGRLSAQQFTGIDDDSITLDGYIHPHFRGGIGQMPLMRATAENGEPLPLIYAFESLGEYCGLWVIDSIKEGRTVFFKDGTPRRIDFSITLKAYGEDADQEAAIAGLFSAAIYGITPPALAGVDGVAVITAAQTADMVPDVPLDATGDEIQVAAAAVNGTTIAAQASAQSVGSKVRAALASIASEGLTIIPSSAVTAAADIVNNAAAIANTAAQIGSTVDAFKRNRNQVILSSVTLAANMSGYGRTIAPAITTVKSAYAQIAAMPSAGTEDQKRILAAAALGNVARAADLLAFAVTQAEAQAITVQGKFLND